MRRDVLEWLSMVGKTILVVLGLILLVAGLVQLVVVGPEKVGLTVLAVGLLLTAPPIAFAFRDAVRAARRKRVEEGP